MSEILLAAGMLLLGYILGSTPTGLIITKLVTGKDVRKIESGRTGGTNVGRVAGFWAGVATAFLDGFKGTLAVWLAIWVLPGAPLVHALAGVLAVVGHNYSIFLIERHEGRIRLRGGAGGATTVGAAFGLWWPSILIIIPAGVLVFYFIGYASVATMTVGFASILLFLVLALLGVTPWQYILFGLLVSLALIWALRPNIRRLRAGTERLVGLRARRRNARENKKENTTPARS
jgi:glycerol-3-phosphate acyltransferase PlsY